MRSKSLLVLAVACLGLGGWWLALKAPVESGEIEAPAGALETGSPPEAAGGDGEVSVAIDKVDTGGREQLGTVPAAELDPAPRPATVRAATLSVQVVPPRTSPSGEAKVSGLRVIVTRKGPGEVDTDENGVRVAEGTSDVEGKLHLDVEVFLPEGEELSGLRARIDEDGYTERWANLRTRDEGLSYQAKVTAEPGVTLRGVVVDADGSPVPGSVNLTRQQLTKGEVYWAVMGYTSAKADGRFRLHAAGSSSMPPEPGNLPVLVALSPGHGTARQRDLDFTDRDSLQELRLEVHGDGTLHGRLVDGSGDPVAGVKLDCTSVEWESAHEGGRRSNYTFNFFGAAPGTEIAGDGLNSAESTTGPDGEFRFAGLRPASFLIHAKDDLKDDPWAASGRAAPVRLTPEPVLAAAPEGSDDGLELVFDRRQIIVSLLHADGSPWSLRTSVRASLHDIHSASTGPWSVWPSITVTEQPTDKLRFGREIAPGQFAFAVSGLDPVEVAVMGGEIGKEGFPIEVRTVAWPKGAGTVSVEFQAVEKVLGGSLRLTGTMVQRKDDSYAWAVARHREMLAPEGTPAPPASVFGAPIPIAEVEPATSELFLISHDLSIVDLGTGRQVKRGQTILSQGRPIALPEGRYRVTVTPTTGHDGMFLPECGGDSVEVTVRDGEVVDTNLVIDAGSTVRPYVDIPASKGEAQVSVWLENSHGETIHLNHGTGRGMSWRWPVREAHESNLVASGAYILHAETEEHHISQSIVLKPRECLDVLLQSAPRDR